MRRFGFCLVVLAFLPWVGQAEAVSTVLTFDGLGVGNNVEFSGTYGDNAVNTPNITVEYRTTTPAGIQEGMRFWSTGYGDLTNVAFPKLDGSQGMSWLGQISLVAASGFLVHLNSFDLAAFTACGTPVLGRCPPLNQPVRIVDGSGNVLVNAPQALLVPTLHNHIGLDVTAATLHIQFADSWNVAIDNINFDQVAADPVPEPNTLLLLGFGFGFVAVAAAGRTRRHRKLGL